MQYLDNNQLLNSTIIASQEAGSNENQNSQLKGNNVGSFSSLIFSYYSNIIFQIFNLSHTFLQHLIIYTQNLYYIRWYVYLYFNCYYNQKLIFCIDF